MPFKVPHQNFYFFLRLQVHSLGHCTIKDENLLLHITGPEVGPCCPIASNFCKDMKFILNYP